jgi:hypothetical protein
MKMKSVSLTLASLASLAAAGTEPVTWNAARSVNVDDQTPGYLEKTSGGRAWNAGAISTQQILSSAEPQGISFQCATDATVAMAGLGEASTDSSTVSGFANIEFAMFCNVHADSVSRWQFGPPVTRTLEIYESGAENRLGWTWTPSDVMRVQVVGDVIEYLKNGVVIDTSQRHPTFPLYAETSMRDVGAQLTDVAVDVADAPPTAAPTAVPTTTAPTTPACTDTPASAAAVGSTLIMEASAGYETRSCWP